jgi:hypothetical protein
MERLRCLAGVWKGEGSGSFPTIEPFTYDETLRLEFDRDYPLIHYEQRTRLLSTGEKSHWESGFIRVLDDGQVELSNAQGSGRVEVLRGVCVTGGDWALRLELDSVVFGNDPRLQRTRRVFTLQGDTLHYVKWMATWTTERRELLQHLEATLTR